MPLNNIIISGATGFVGSNLSAYLESNNHQISTLSRKQNATYTYGSFSKEDFNNHHAFIHLAGKAHDLKKTSDDQEYYEVNTELTKRLFDLFLESDCTTFIYFSSVKAVADQVDGTLKENHPYEPETAYGKSKALAEQYLISKELPKDKRLYILRPCMIHGPGNKGNLNLLYKLVLRGIPYPLAAFENKRSFVSVNTINEVINKLLIHFPQSNIFNIADDEAISTNELIEVISNALSKKPRLIPVHPSLVKIIASIGSVVRLPLNTERLQKLTESYVVSNKKIKEVLHLDTPFDTKQGLNATIKSFKKL